MHLTGPGKVSRQDYSRACGEIENAKWYLHAFRVTVNASFDCDLRCRLSDLYRSASRHRFYGGTPGADLAVRVRQASALLDLVALAADVRVSSHRCLVCQRLLNEQRGALSQYR